MQDIGFDEYLDYLRESIDGLWTYFDNIGHDDPNISRIKLALNNPDPFVVYRASLAATVLLSDKSIYH